MEYLKPVHRGLDVILFLGRTMSPIKITNKINGEWEKSLSGIKT